MYTAFITGGADGIGRAIAVQAARLNYNVVVVDIAVDGLRETVALVEAEGVAALALTADMRDEAEVAAAVAAAAKRFGGIDMLVCNAGVVSAGPFDEIPLAEWQRVIDINLLGAVRCVNAAVPHLRRSAHARIVLVGSSQAIMPNNPLATPYVASKYALRGYAEVLEPVLAAENILLHFFCPGLTRTAFPLNATRFGAAPIASPDLTHALTPAAVAERLMVGARGLQFLISTSDRAGEIMHARIDAMLSLPRDVA